MAEFGDTAAVTSERDAHGAAVAALLLLLQATSLP
jgi:hypothetical protein